MRSLFAPILALVIGLTSFASAQVPVDGGLCRWDMGPPTFSNPLATLSDTACFDLSPLSVIWLNNDGCACVVDMRIIGSFKACGQDPFAVPPGETEPPCESFEFSYSITGASTTQGNFMGEFLDGTATPNNQPPPVWYEEAMPVPCGDVFVFDMTTECRCTTTIERTRPARVIPGSITFRGGQTISIAPVNASVTYIETVVVCEDGDSVGQFSAYCVEDCDPLDPPANIPIEAAP